MSDDEFLQAGGNRSAVHVDFMIGSVANSTSTACATALRLSQ